MAFLFTLSQQTKKSIFKTMSSVFDYENTEDVGDFSEKAEPVISEHNDNQVAIDTDEATSFTKPSFKNNDTEDILNPIYWTELFNKHK